MPRYLVTSALPYANGPLHFGHMVGAYLPADVYVRTLRMQGEDVRFVCGTDEHGVAITIHAEREGVPYAEYVARWREHIGASMARLGIEFDIFSGTSVSPGHAALSQEFFRRLGENGYLIEQESEQLYCATDELFLADRYIEGTCPKCGFEQARGDECPRCGTWIDPLAMPVVRCKLCGTTPQRRSTRHWYLDLPKLRDEYLGRWVAEHDWKPNVKAFLANLLEDTRPRAITRDMSWGVPVPEDLAHGQTGKVLYVWFDAPIGYISFTQEWARREGRPEAWRDYWCPADPAQVRVVHFLGKDNIPFHCFVFPAMLYGVEQDFVLPWAVPANEFYNLEGAKFSTSGAWSIPLERFFERYDAESARFYLLSSAPETADSEWSWQGFQAANNTLLADTIGNLVTRVLRFIDKHFEGRAPALADAHAAELDELLLAGSGPIGDPAEHVRAFRFRRAAEQLIENARAANVFVDRTAPWGLRTSDLERCASVLHTCCDYLAWIARWMAPLLPGKAQALWAMLGRSGAVAEAGWPGVPVPGAWRSQTAGTPLGEV
ncbi:MAG TPA: methionine--tRNA ligase, partial [Planctomycetota bacterium]|nr:methionine--tRNA ligase [Planctomycetota bacterium]